MGLFLMHLWGVAFVIPGLFLIGLAIRNTVKGHASHQWQPTQCKILRSFVMVERDSDTRAESMTPAVEYEYQFEGKSLRGTRIRYGQIGTSGRNAAEKVLAPFVKGTSVPVFVNPKKPQESSLLQGMSWGNVFIVLAGAIFVWAGWVLLQVNK